MTALITGGSGSGKSELAERLAISLGEDRLYAATMLPYGEEAEERIRRHREMRSGKGFRTVECYTDLDGLDVTADTVVLLECMSNLLANTMFSCDGVYTPDVTEGLIRAVCALGDRCKSLVIVSNEIFSDGVQYDEASIRYIENLAVINRALAAYCDTVAEVVCGIPLYMKGR